MFAGTTATTAAAAATQFGEGGRKPNEAGSDCSDQRTKGDDII